MEKSWNKEKGFFAQSYEDRVRAHISSPTSKTRRKSSVLTSSFICLFAVGIGYPRQRGSHHAPGVLLQRRRSTIHEHAQVDLEERGSRRVDFERSRLPVRYFSCRGWRRRRRRRSVFPRFCERYINGLCAETYGLSSLISFLFVHFVGG